MWKEDYKWIQKQAVQNTKTSVRSCYGFLFFGFINITIMFWPKTCSTSPDCFFNPPSETSFSLDPSMFLGAESCLTTWFAPAIWKGITTRPRMCGHRPHIAEVLSYFWDHMNSEEFTWIRQCTILCSRLQQNLVATNSQSFYLHVKWLCCKLEVCFRKAAGLEQCYP